MSITSRIAAGLIVGTALVGPGVAQASPHGPGPGGAVLSQKAYLSDSSGFQLDAASTTEGGLITMTGRATCTQPDFENDVALVGVSDDGTETDVTPPPRTLHDCVYSFNVASGTARNGVHYQGVKGEFAIAAGKVRQPFRLVFRTNDLSGGRGPGVRGSDLTFNVVVGKTTYDTNGRVMASWTTVGGSWLQYQVARIVRKPGTCRACATAPEAQLRG